MLEVLHKNRALYPLGGLTKSPETPVQQY